VENFNNDSEQTKKLLITQYKESNISSEQKKKHKTHEKK
jgi:hypothetical protein